MTKNLAYYNGVKENENKKKIKEEIKEEDEFEKDDKKDSGKHSNDGNGDKSISSNEDDSSVNKSKDKEYND